MVRKRKQRRMSRPQAKLAVENYGLVPYAMNLYLSRGRAVKHVRDQLWEDILPVAEDALMRAAMGFRPDLGFKFSTYATRAIFVSINRKFKMESERRDTLRRNADAGARGCVRSGFNVFDDGEVERAEAVDDQAPELGADLDAETICGDLRGLLTTQQRRVLGLRFSEAQMTLEQAGDRVGITKERVRQIENAAIERLQSHYLPSIERRRWDRPGSETLDLYVGVDLVGLVWRAEEGYRYQCDWPFISAIAGRCNRVFEGQRIVEQFIEDVLRFRRGKS